MVLRVLLDVRRGDDLVLVRAALRHSAERPGVGAQRPRGRRDAAVRARRGGAAAAQESPRGRDGFETSAMEPPWPPLFS